MTACHATLPWEIFHNGANKTWLLSKTRPKTPFGPRTTRKGMHPKRKTYNYPTTAFAMHL